MLALVLGRATAMARVPAGLPAGIRLTDHISLGVIARTFPIDEVRRGLGGADKGAGWGEEGLSPAPAPASARRRCGGCTSGWCARWRRPPPRARGTASGVWSAWTGSCLDVADTA